MLRRCEQKREREGETEHERPAKPWTQVVHATVIRAADGESQPPRRTQRSCEMGCHGINAKNHFPTHNEVFRKPTIGSKMQ